MSSELILIIQEWEGSDNFAGRWFCWAVILLVLISGW